MLKFFSKNAHVFIIIIFLFFCKAVFSSCGIDSLESIVNSKMNVCKKTEILLEHISGILSHNLDELVELSEKTLEEAKILEDEKAEANSYYLLAEPHYLNYEYKNALLFYKKALFLYEKLGVQKEIANTQKNIGLCFFYLDNYENALESYLQGLEINKELNDQEQESILLQNIGILYYGWEKYDEALNYYEESYMLFTHLYDTVRFSGALNNMANTYMEMGEVEKAIETYKKSLELCLKLEDKEGIAICYTNMAINYNIFKQFDKALLYYDKALLIYEEMDHKPGILAILSGIAVTYSNMGHVSSDPNSMYFPLAMDYFNQACERAVRIGDILETMNSYYGISNIYEMQADFKKSLEFYKKHVALKDSVFNEKKYAQTILMEEKLQKENSALEKVFEDKIVVLENNNRLRLRLLLGMNVLSLFLLLFIVYKFFQLRGKLRQ